VDRILKCTYASIGVSVPLSATLYCFYNMCNIWCMSLDHDNNISTQKYNIKWQIIIRHYYTTQSIYSILQLSVVLLVLHNSLASLELPASRQVATYHMYIVCGIPTDQSSTKPITMPNTNTWVHLESLNSYWILHILVVSVSRKLGTCLMRLLRLL